MNNYFATGFLFFNSLLFASQPPEMGRPSLRSQELPQSAADALAMFKDPKGRQILEENANSSYNWSDRSPCECGRCFHLSPYGKTIRLLCNVAKSVADQELSAELLTLYLGKRQADNKEGILACKDLPPRSLLRELAERSRQKDRNSMPVILHGALEGLNVPCVRVLLDKFEASPIKGLTHSECGFRCCFCSCPNKICGVEIKPLAVVASYEESSAALTLFDLLVERGARFDHSVLKDINERKKFGIRDHWGLRYNALLEAERKRKLDELNRKLFLEEPEFVVDSKDEKEKEKARQHEASTAMDWKDDK